MLGDAGVGKTCIVNRYIKGQFSETEATLGSNYSAKVLDVKPDPVMPS
jgi:GTPase SAR1 family protein